MGRAIVALIDRELVSVFGESAGDHNPVFARQADEERARRQVEDARREWDVAAAERRIRRWSEHLRSRENELEALQLQVEMQSKLSARPADTLVKVGRNDRCPRESELKYKYCHGLPVGRSHPPPR